MISLFCHCPIFKWRLFQSFHLSIRTEGASPVMGLCQAVIVSVPFWPRHRSALCMWKEAERRGEHWIDTQTFFCSLTLCLPLPRDWGADTGTINEGSPTPSSSSGRSNSAQPAKWVYSVLLPIILLNDLWNVLSHIQRLGCWMLLNSGHFHKSLWYWNIFSVGLFASIPCSTRSEM
jgi:hypothetical protein